MGRSENASAKSRRHEAILAELRASPAIRILDLAAAHGVSTETIRRDLDALSAAGLISRTYGGATGAPHTGEPQLDERYRQNASARHAIARAAAPLIADGESVMIDAGATTIDVARRLAAERNDLTVVTTSFGVASALAANPSMRIRMCPGDYDPRDGGVSGPDAVDYLGQFNAAHAIIGASRLDAEGPSDFNAGSVWIKRAMVKHAAAAILVIDHSKFDQVGFERICALEALRVVVTDEIPGRGLAEALARARVELRTGP